MSKEEYFYKFSKTNGELYLQVWKRINGKSEYVASIGKAEKASKLLVELEKLRKQTKKYEEILTKFVSEESVKNDQNNN